MKRYDGSTKNYKFGPKNNWRRTIWNEVLRRTDGREQDGIILYLAGPQDNDRKVATQKGVHNRNLIAIDRNRDNVIDIRNQGNFAINADVSDVLSSWSRSAPVCAVVLDFCAGLMDYDGLVKLCLSWLTNPSLMNAVLAINLQRGRDRNDGSELARRVWSDVTTRSVACQSGLVENDPKHRGGAMVTYILYYVSICMHLAGTVKLYDENSIRVYEEFMASLVLQMQPKYMSYKSGIVVFDSCVVNPIADRFDWRFPKGINNIKELRTMTSDTDTSHLVAATLAVRNRVG